ncbi:hypothetical protein BJY22_003871 [Kribbella shirazensis]|uniref:Uncharacterized protein n=1 Tax=Kribbella shirazensis TaxID=1105143 RepID=A0A7X5VBW8_9ACTN|nr:hypothetical protein [Kribbella shirazensis]
MALNICPPTPHQPGVVDTEPRTVGPSPGPGDSRRFQAVPGDSGRAHSRRACRVHVSVHGARTAPARRPHGARRTSRCRPHLSEPVRAGGTAPVVPRRRSLPELVGACRAARDPGPALDLPATGALHFTGHTGPRRPFQQATQHRAGRHAGPAPRWTCLPQAHCTSPATPDRTAPSNRQPSTTPGHTPARRCARRACHRRTAPHRPHRTSPGFHRPRGAAQGGTRARPRGGRASRRGTAPQQPHRKAPPLQRQPSGASSHTPARPRAGRGSHRRAGLHRPFQIAVPLHRRRSTAPGHRRAGARVGCTHVAACPPAATQPPDSVAEEMELAGGDEARYAERLAAGALSWVGACAEWVAGGSPWGLRLMVGLVGVVGLRMGVCQLFPRRPFGLSR